MTLQLDSKAVIEYKQWALANARQVLKEEFVGIDTVIDRVIDSINTWYLFPELQERPVIINLWGMTGVGKTALILRLSELLEYSKKLFRFDMGNNSNDQLTIRNSLEKIFQYNNGMPNIIMLDEFQHARTKNHDEHEMDNNYSRIIWDVMDSGKFQSIRNGEEDIQSLIKARKILSECLKAGVEVKDGHVINHELFLQLLSQLWDNEFDFGEPNMNHVYTENGNTRVKFLSGDIYRVLYNCFLDKYKSIRHLIRRLDKLDGLQSLRVIDKAIEFAESNKWIDCSKSLIFVLGNLDEAYRMSSTFNPDINADEFHEASKFININHVKRALKKRFRNEQISRLGNNHIIYPAFDESSFKKLIDLEFMKVSNATLKKFGISLSFSQEFAALVYREGVYPTQGTRPLFTTVYQFVNTKLPWLISEDKLRNLDADMIRFHYEDGKMNYEYHKDGWSLLNIDEEVELNLDKLRAPAKDDMQAITAVHEAGHAVVTISAFHVLPEYICSTSADADSLGFSLTRNKWKHFSKDEVIKRIAECFGGLMAEKLVFGESKITRGAEEDIETATSLATKVIKDYGMGKAVASIDMASSNTKYSYHDRNGEQNEEVRLLLEEGCKLAESIIISEEQLLLQLADYLSDERMIKKPAIEEKVRGYGSPELRNIQFIENGDLMYYRNALKSKVKNLSNGSVVNSNAFASKSPRPIDI